MRISHTMLFFSTCKDSFNRFACALHKSFCIAEYGGNPRLFPYIQPKHDGLQPFGSSDFECIIAYFEQIAGLLLIRFIDLAVVSVITDTISENSDCIKYNRYDFRERRTRNARPYI